METKKTPKASLENKRVLFAEVGLILALAAMKHRYQLEISILVSLLAQLLLQIRLYREKLLQQESLALN